MADRSQLPKYDSPPVVETVLGVQFAPVPQFNEALGGWYWKKYLGPEWDRAAIVPRLEDQFERFGDVKFWGPESFLTIRSSFGERLQIFRADNERMIQIQNTRFLYNWRKQSAHYPSYEKLSPEFTTSFEMFERFLKDEGAEKVSMNQWEVTYVNHIPKGALWKTPDDWPKIFPWFANPAISPTQQPEDFRGEWSARIGEDMARLHVSLKYVRIGSIAGPEVLALQLTARGPLKDSSTLADSLHMGHEAIVRSFTAMTSDLAHQHWRRTS